MQPAAAVVDDQDSGVAPRRPAEHHHVIPRREAGVVDQDRTARTQARDGSGLPPEKHAQEEPSLALAWLASELEAGCGHQRDLGIAVGERPKASCGAAAPFFRGPYLTRREPPHQQRDTNGPERGLHGSPARNRLRQGPRAPAQEQSDAGVAEVGVPWHLAQRRRPYCPSRSCRMTARGELAALSVPSQRRYAPIQAPATRATVAPNRGVPTPARRAGSSVASR